MAAKSSLANMTICLTAVCLVCAAILGVTYAVTSEPIQEASRKAVAESVAKVLPQGGNLSEKQEGVLAGTSYDYYTSTSETGEILGYAVKSTTIGFGGPLTVMAGILPDGTVHNTSVLECNETPGLGAKCVECEGAFRTQFAGFNPSERKLEVEKDGGDVDAITASTITSRAFCKAVQQAVAAYRLIAPEPVCEAADSLAVENSTEGE